MRTAAAGPADLVWSDGRRAWSDWLALGRMGPELVWPGDLGWSGGVLDPLLAALTGGAWLEVIAGSVASTRARAGPVGSLADGGLVRPG
ncbi:hypothetical protein [Streptomyces zagrosensis]|uniref:Uncharacterized protein n=1 Tax=Streptomyces zagrosensis TaxID=1042984 RepID=A0A7W9Q6Y0_9ACTN|nr:hypothetical protein [Streptomyces zagrosensis]MBB5934288.1 hypothetical protein [Streptomyces zagrosensis]